MGVRVNGLGHYRSVASSAEVEPESRPPALVLGFGNIDEAQISKGIRKLAEAVRHQTESKIVQAISEPESTPYLISDG